MMRSFVREQNRTVSVGFRPRNRSPGKRLVKRSFFETPRRPSCTLRDNYLVNDGGNEFPVLLEFCG